MCKSEVSQKSLSDFKQFVVNATPYIVRWYFRFSRSSGRIVRNRFKHYAILAIGSNVQTTQMKSLKTSGSTLLNSTVRTHRWFVLYDFVLRIRWLSRLARTVLKQLLRNINYYYLSIIYTVAYSFFFTGFFVVFFFSKRLIAYRAITITTIRLSHSSVKHTGFVIIVSDPGAAAVARKIFQKCFGHLRRPVNKNYLVNSLITR